MPLPFGPKRILPAFAPLASGQGSQQRRKNSNLRMRKFLKILKWTAAIGIALILLLLVAGYFYEEGGRQKDRRALPQIGTSYDIGGRTLNMFCSGSGNPAVIIDTGAGEPGYAWSHIQPELARFTRACWYDRAGTGWSDAGPYPRDSEAIARDLHELVQRAGVAPPYVLAGHSFGGLTARVYSRLYPDDVAGMVLIESAHEGEPERAPREYRGRTAPRWAWRPLHILLRAGARFGVIRLFTETPPLPADTARRTREQIVAALRAFPLASAYVWSEGIVNQRSYAEAHVATPPGHWPLLVLTRGAPVSTDPRIVAWENVWRNELQAGLTRLSTRGSQIIVQNSGHGIPDEAPAAVVDAIRTVVVRARSAGQ
jgi:pimeloyl-ACP methyl ester carboxylesterase